jgi:hypothetical protein
MKEPPATRADIKHLEEIILQSSNGFERRQTTIETELRTGFDRIDASVQRHSGMIESGIQSIATMDKSISSMEGQIRDLNARVLTLEQKAWTGDDAT